MRTPSVRDLYWILKGPGLLNPEHPAFADRLLRDDWFQEKAREGEEWFRRCDENPAALLEDLKSRENQTMLLGRYFEALLSFWIREYLKPEAFYGGVPVQEHEPSKPGQGRNTVGEFDFVFKLPGHGALPSQIYHWEAAVKFYLFAGETPDQALKMNHYFGTLHRDRLDIKVAKIFHHQLKLSERLDGESVLAYLGLPSPQPLAWIKGMLFYPAQSSCQNSWKNHVHPLEVSPHHQKGWWTEIHQLDVPVENRDDRWVILPKHRWLSPAMVQPQKGDEQRLFTLDEMKAHCQAHFAEHLSPLMWAEVSWNESMKAWNEVNRGLVVYSGWLGKALESLAGSS
ncbi:MAG: DUF1853 family protein [Bdellovibrionia bacterium]